MFLFLTQIEKMDDGEKPVDAQQEPEPDPEPDEEEGEISKPKKVPNQFNFCERAALTYNNLMRVSKRLQFDQCLILNFVCYREN